jgi:sulfite exporter TauE/SafE
VERLFLGFASGVGLAWLASVHCRVMCGPVAMMVHARGGSAASLRYLAGRVLSYALLGFVAGSASHALTALPGALWVEAALSWALALALLVNAVRLTRGRRSQGLVQLGVAPRRQSLHARLLARLADDPWLLGLGTALLPCGALFAAIMAAAALGDAWLGALALATFAALTGLSLAGVGQLARLVSRPRARWLVPAALLLGAAIMIWRPIPALRAVGHAPSCPMHAEVL